MMNYLWNFAKENQFSGVKSEFCVKFLGSIQNRMQNSDRKWRNTAKFCRSVRRAIIGALFWLYLGTIKLVHGSTIACGPGFCSLAFLWWENQPLEWRMEAEAERIAQENRQRDWERAHGGGVAHG